MVKTRIPTPRKSLSANGLLQNLKQSFQQITDLRTGNPTISLDDALMSAMAMFSLKDPSMLAFDQRRQSDEDNLTRIYGIQNVPSDSSMREILDPVDHEQLRPAFANIFASLISGKALEDFRFIDGHYLLALDGTEHFSSQKIHCDQCLERHHRDGKITYHHQMLGAVLACPGRPEVIPIMPEPIIKQDGETKNDCERNALKRFLKKFRKDHPVLSVIATLDALYANAPVIRDLEKAEMRWIIRVKPDGNRFLFQQVEQFAEQGSTIEFDAVGSDGIHRRYRLAKNVPLNESNLDVLVDFLEVIEPHKSGQRCFVYIVDPRLKLNQTRSEPLMQAGRVRWKVENEAFNTLKNQGYHFEHNYGHGHRNLAVVLAQLMMLAFLVDQVQQLCCPLFAAALEKCHSRRRLWEAMREVYHQFQVTSMQAIYEVLLSSEKPIHQAAWNS